jgi:hypothetical protein
LYAAEQILLRLKNAFVFVLCENPRRHLESWYHTWLAVGNLELHWFIITALVTSKCIIL